MTTDYKQNIFDEILGDLAFYSYPDLLLEKYRGLLDISRVNKTELDKYVKLLTNIQYAWKKTLKYEKYFEDFYPPVDKIDKIEALNHHIHAYLEDMTILKNKIEVFFGELKNDIKKIAINKNETTAFFKAGIEKTEEVFKNISKYRGPHHHKGMRFVDGDLLKAENASNMIVAFKNPIYANMLNPERVSEFIKKLENDKEESFNKAKIRWIGIAQKNNKQTSGYLDAILKEVYKILYQFLNIKSTIETFNLVNKQ